MLNSDDTRREGGFDLDAAPDLNVEAFTAGKKAVEDALPQPIRFEDWESVENLTEDQAHQVIRAARRMLLEHLLSQELHEHMLDDCGDYLAAATDGWGWLYGVYFNNDGESATVIEEVKKFLKVDETYPLGGSDGEIRNDLLTEDMMNFILDRDN